MDPIDIKRKVSEYYGKPSANKSHSLDKMNQFLKKTQTTKTH